MNKEELTQFLKENLSIDLSFRRYTYGGNNELELKVKLGGEEIYKTSVTVDPTQDKSYD